MAKGFINDSTLTAIADAIRAKAGTSGAMLPSAMAGLIESISAGGEYEATTGELTYSSRATISTSGGTLLDTGLSGPVEYFLIVTKHYTTLHSGVTSDSPDVQQAFITPTEQWHCLCYGTSSNVSTIEPKTSNVSLYRIFTVDGSKIKVTKSPSGGWSNISLKGSYIWAALRRLNS